MSGFPDTFSRCSALVIERLSHRQVGTMPWDVLDGIHEGWLSAVIPDGRTSTDVRAGGVHVQGITGAYPRHPLMPNHEIVPDDQVMGWQAVCACGWTGPLWERVQTPKEVSISKRQAFVPFLGDAVPSVAVEEAIGKEWSGHAVPAAAVAELESAYRALKNAESRISRGVTSARLAGVSWARIGATQEISRQSAHERWNS